MVFLCHDVTGLLNCYGAVGQRRLIVVVWQPLNNISAYGSKTVGERKMHANYPSVQ